MEEILFYVAYLLETVVDVYIMAGLMKVFLEIRPERKRYLITFCILRLVICTVQYICFPFAWLNAITGIVTLLLIVHVYEGSRMKKITVVFICEICLLASECVAGIVMRIQKYNDKLSLSGHNGDAFAFVVMSVTLAVEYKIMHSFQNIHKEIGIPRMFSGIVIILNFVICILESAIFVGDSLTDEIRFLSVVCVILILFLIIYLYDSLSGVYMEKMQMELIEREKSYYCKQAELLQQNSEELSNFRHDNMNHLYALQSMLNDSDIEARKYMEKLIGKMQDVRVYSHTGNVALDSVVNYKLNEAESKNIAVTSQIFLPRQMDFEIEDLVAILGNLLDNAIEAAEKVDKGRYVDIDMRYKAGVLFLCVKNNYDGMLAVQNGEITTRKADKKFHGIGLKSIRSSVESHDGTMDIEYTKRDFVVRIMLYM